MADEYGEYPEFRLRLPNGGPEARGRLTHQMGTNGSQRFIVAPGQPVRPDVVPSFTKRAASAHRLREKLIDEGRIRRSSVWPGWLETADEITFNSASEAASVLTGGSIKGWMDWRTEDGHPLGDFWTGTAWGPHRAWLVRGSNVTGLDLVQRLWLPEGRVTLAASRLRQGVAEGIAKDRLRTLVQEDYGSTATYGQKQRLVEELHAFLSRMRPGDTVCTLSGGQLYVGEVTGGVEQIDSEDGRSNLRRPVTWQEISHPYDGLPEELQQKLSIQHDIVELTSVQAVIDGLGLTDQELEDEAEALERDPTVEIPAITVRRELELPEPTDELAVKLLVHCGRSGICCGTSGSWCSTARRARARRIWR